MTATLTLGDMTFTPAQHEAAKTELRAICGRCNAIIARADADAKQYYVSGNRDLKVAAKRVAAEARKIKREVAAAYFGWANEIGLGMEAFGDF